MASDAYKKALKEIPEHIQKDVVESINIANEIYECLQRKGMSASDLAHSMNKAESEISKWLSGQHNFTLKTVRKIEDAIDCDILVTASSKIKDYENMLEQANSTIELLEHKLACVNIKDNGFENLTQNSWTTLDADEIENPENDHRYTARIYSGNESKPFHLETETKSSFKLEITNT